jgi:hypothetical protein
MVYHLDGICFNDNNVQNCIDFVNYNDKACEIEAANAK